MIDDNVWLKNAINKIIIMRCKAHSVRVSLVVSSFRWGVRDSSFAYRILGRMLHTRNNYSYTFESNNESSHPKNDFERRSVSEYTGTYMQIYMYNTIILLWH